MEKTLYKLDKKGNLRFFKLTYKGNKVISEYGIIDGKSTISEYVCKGKNIGKKNETTPKEQAKLEFESKLRKKLDLGFEEDKNVALNTEIISPMLAIDYEKGKKNINYNEFVFTQAKLDGMRCMAIIKNGNVTLISRQGKDICGTWSNTMKHIVKEIKSTIGNKDIILDGELYNHNMTFQEIMSAIKKSSDKNKKINYYIYDIVLDKPYIDRLTEIQNIIDNNHKYLHIVHTDQIRNENELKKNHTKHVKNNYEGTIIRHTNLNYEMGSRSKQLLKYKDFIDMAYEIIDIIPEDKRPNQGKVKCVNDNGDEFLCIMKFSHEERVNILSNKNDYIGKTAEVRFMEYTDDGKPRFPVCVGIRLDK